MRRPTRFISTAMLLALILALTACAQGGGSKTPVSNETPVPEGMPVMYEFYTDT